MRATRISLVQRCNCFDRTQPRTRQTRERRRENGFCSDDDDDENDKPTKLTDRYDRKPEDRAKVFIKNVYFFF